MKRNSPAIAAGLFAVWAISSLVGFLSLAAYHGRPGRAGSPPDRWLAGSLVPLDPTLPTLLIFIHPRCPCSGASLAELAEVEARFRGRFAGHLLSFRPDEPDEGWGLVGDAAEDALPGLDHWADRGRREALRFGGRTSGHVLLFDPSGRRLFSGGITISRGHQGVNPSLDDLIATIMGGPAGPRSSPVFGGPVIAPAPSLPPEDVSNGIQKIGSPSRFMIVDLKSFPNLGLQSGIGDLKSANFFPESVS